MLPKFFKAYLTLVIYMVCSIQSAFADSRGASSEEFDFVVGGGTAGCAVSSLLSRNGKHSVLLLHEGGFPHPRLEVDAVTTEFYRSLDSTMARTFEVNTGQRFPATSILVGRALGGSSTINGMFMNRGSPLDYDNWAYNVTGDLSWSYKNMLMYFKKSEAYNGNFRTDQRGYHGSIFVSSPQYDLFLQAWLDAGRELGYPQFADSNGPQQTSFTTVDFSQLRGRRVSSYKGYLEEAILSSRSNLRVLTNAEATRIVFHGTKAVGIEYTINSTGSPEFGYVKAHKEIILSGGFIGSPTLLLRSGIGPENVLKAGNTPPVKILPVGRNLQDHPNIYLDFAVNNKSFFHSPDTDLTPAAMQQFLMFGDGPYRKLTTSRQAFLASSVTKRAGHPDWADIHLIPISRPVLTSNEPERGTQIQEYEQRVGCIILLGRPYSRGVLSLNTTNVSGPPVINFQYLSNPLDRKILLDGIREVFQIFETPAFRRYGSYTPIPREECAHFQFLSDEYWDCYVETVQTGFHGSGTCKMGRGADDPTAVVDSKLRVIGVDRLRVIDASIMPMITNANPQAAIYGIAEKTSEDILGDWSTSS